MFNRFKDSSEKTKNIVAFSISGGVTLIITLLWFIFGLPSILGNDEGRVVAEEKSSSPFKIALDYLSSLPASAKEGLDQISESFSQTGVLDDKVEYKSN